MISLSLNTVVKVCKSCQTDANKTVQLVHLIILVRVQECCFRWLLRQILILFTFELRHDSVVEGKGGENHGRQWGVSLTVRKTDRRREDWAGWVHLHPVVWLLSSCCNLSQQKSGIFWGRGEARAGRGGRSKCHVQH